MRDFSGWTCLHYALSLPDPSPAAAAWIAAALALPGIAALREEALRDLASVEAEPVALELFRGSTGAAQVRRVGWLAGTVAVSVTTLQNVLSKLELTSGSRSILVTPYSSSPMLEQQHSQPHPHLPSARHWLTPHLHHHLTPP